MLDFFQSEFRIPKSQIEWLDAGCPILDFFQSEICIPKSQFESLEA